MINPLTGGLEFTKEIETETELNDIGSIDINKNFDPVPSLLSNKDRVQLIKSVGEEIVKEEEIDALIQKKLMPVVYDGFEPSGRMHIAQGIMRTLNVNKLVKAGCQFVFWVADWFAVLNNKLGGDIEKIRIVGRYFVEIWRAAGMDLRNVKFLWCSDEINKHSYEYWSRVIDIARKNTYDRIMRCNQIMGRSDKDSVYGSMIMYPCMQCSDIFFLKADICQLGMDQRKVNMLAREYCDDIKKEDKPIIISHHMLAGLDGQKMSKTDPDKAIFMEDSADEVRRKINKAVCPPGKIEDNPVWEYIRYIVFEAREHFLLKRLEGEPVKYTDLNELAKDYISEKIHPGDLKNSVTDHINEILEPVRQHFEKDPYAKKLLELVMSFRVSR
jgi:tyrosyl-tRNA synthetase